MPTLPASCISLSNLCKTIGRASHSAHIYYTSVAPYTAHRAALDRCAAERIAYITGCVDPVAARLPCHSREPTARHPGFRRCKAVLLQLKREK
jgi:hypothetical protein